MKIRNPIFKETIQRGYEKIYSRTSKLLSELSNGVVIELDEEYPYES